MAANIEIISAKLGLNTNTLCLTALYNQIYMHRFEV